MHPILNFLAKLFLKFLFHSENNGSLGFGEFKLLQKLFLKFLFHSENNGCFGFGKFKLLQKFVLFEVNYMYIEH